MGGGWYTPKDMGHMNRAPYVYTFYDTIGEQYELKHR